MTACLLEPLSRVEAVYKHKFIFVWIKSCVKFQTMVQVLQQDASADMMVDEALDGTGLKRIACSWGTARFFN